MTITSKLTNVQIVVRDIATVVASYDKIRLYRSTTGASGTYTEITAVAAAAATMTGVRKEPFTLSGKEFAVEVDGAEETHTFTAIITAAAAASEITANTSLVAIDASGYVQITSPTTTTASTIEFAAASAGAVALGFYEEDNDHGEEVWPSLVGGTFVYTVTDYQGSSDYWYKTKYYNTTSGVYSDYSGAFQGMEAGSLEPTDIIYGTGYLVDMDGTPLENTKVFIYNRFVPTIVSSKVVSGTRQVYTTEADGWVQVPLVHGARITMSIEGTKMVRDIDVPSTGTTFDLMTTDIQDSIGIVSYDLTDATRTTI